MKTLVYTISNFSKDSDECIRLLHKSLTEKNFGFDFLVISNTYNSLNTFEFTTIVDDSIETSDWIGYLKFSPLIPKGYDLYLYLDSDILYFGKLEWLYERNSLISITNDKGYMTDEWFLYPYYDINLTDILSKTLSVNSGSFAFQKTEILESIRNLFIPFLLEKRTPHKNAMFEQSCFNYLVFDLLKKNMNVYNFTHLVQLYAGDVYCPIKDKYLYHFCGFSNEMSSKTSKMKKFYETYKEHEKNLSLL